MPSILTKQVRMLYYYINNINHLIIYIWEMRDCSPDPIYIKYIYIINISLISYYHNYTIKTVGICWYMQDSPSCGIP